MSKMPFISAFAVMFCSLVSAQSANPVATDEIMALLRAGVPSAEVAALVTRRGAPEMVTEGDLKAVEAAGGSKKLMSVLARRHEAHTELRRLAMNFDTWSHEGAGVTLIHPRAWLVSRKVENDRALISIQRDPEGERIWFRTPRLFVWVQRGTPFPQSSEPELAAKIARLVARRLGGAGMDPRAQVTGRGKLSGQTCPEHSMTATVPRVEFHGTMVVRTRVLDDGTVVTAGYTCSIGDEDTTRKLFDEFANTLAVAPRS